MHTFHFVELFKLSKRSSIKFSKMKALDRHIKDKKVFKKVNNDAIYCQACEERIIIEHSAVKFCIQSHEKSQKHIRKFQSWSATGSQQVSIVDSLIVKDAKFNQDLAKFLTACNIPWTKVSSRAFADFFKTLGKKLPDEITLRRQLPQLFNSTLADIRRDIEESWIYMQVDEARIADRAIVSVLIGRLDGKKPVSHCLNIVELDDKIDSTRIIQIVNDSLHILWPEHIFYDRFRLLIRDQASYMLKVGRELKFLHPQLLHITCLCHARHRVAEQIHADNSMTKKFIEKFCKVISRSKRRQNMLSFTIGSSIHSLPVVTRWGTWISFCGFLHKHFDKIKEFIKEIEDEDNQAIDILSELASDKKVQEELISINQLQHLVLSIKQLEEIGLTIYQQKELLNEAKEKLPFRYQAKLKASLDKNPSIDEIFSFDSHETATNYSFAPLVSVDVERSFSQLKNILTDRRQSFTQENFKMYSIVQLYYKKAEK